MQEINKRGIMTWTWKDELVEVLIDLGGVGTANEIQQKIIERGKKVFNSSSVRQCLQDHCKSKSFRANIELFEHIGKQRSGTYKLIKDNNSTKQTIDEILEGYIVEKKVFEYKRNKEIAEKRKIKDNYTCQACGFKLRHNEKYIIECHHKTPLSSSKKIISTIEMLVSICPTCHSIAHLQNPPFTIAEIKEIRKINQRLA